MNVLVIGGSGFLSGTLVRVAQEMGHRIWAVTRGQRPMPSGVRPIVADRKARPAFRTAIESIVAPPWDLVVDCIGFNADDAEQDLDCFTGRARHLVFVSTDFVIRPHGRPWKIDETYDRFHDSPYGAGKRAAEEALLNGPGALAVTIVRPGHIYGPGSLLGCLPFAGRDPQLLDKLRRGEAIPLVGGGYFLQQPIFAEDLARLLLSIAGNVKTHSQIFFGAGAEVIESRRFYQILADILGVELKIEEVSVQKTLAEKPELASFFTHRVYDMSKAERAGLAMPATSLETGLRKHVEALSK